jgi:signal peptidase I
VPARRSPDDEVAVEDDIDAEAPPPSRCERLLRRRRERKRGFVEWVAVIGAAVLVAFLLRTFVVQTFYIPSGSMEPTLAKDDRVVVNKLSYRLHDVNRGDIVVFTTPPLVENKAFKDLVKRVIALEGETVEAKDGKVFVNGQQLAEKYLPVGTYTSDFGPETVPPDSVWVMGDNRGNSEDSRVFKSIEEDTIVGRVFLRVWPVTRIDIL